MRSIKTFAKDIFKKPPSIFLWVALFHIAMLVYQVWLYSEFPFPSIAWLQPAWILAYTIAWLFVCDMRRWAAWLYIGLTVSDLTLYLSLKSPVERDHYMSSMFIINVAFGFAILMFYKRFE